MFEIKLEALEILKRLDRKDHITKRILPDITTNVLLFHEELEDLVYKDYNLPYGLDRVVDGKPVDFRGFGNTLLSVGLRYKNVPVPLHLYPFEIRDHDAVSKVPVRYPNDYVKWTPARVSKEVISKVNKRGRGKIARRGKNYRYKGYYTGNQIRARLQKRTWKVYPSKGVLGERAPTKMLFGPSVAELASKTFTSNSADMQRIVNRLSQNMAKSFAKAYR